MQGKMVICKESSDVGRQIQKTSMTLTQGLEQGGKKSKHTSWFCFFFFKKKNVSGFDKSWTS